jgi:hypothetical protein
MRRRNALLEAVITDHHDPVPALRCLRTGALCSLLKNSPMTRANDSLSE